VPTASDELYSCLAECSQWSLNSSAGDVDRMSGLVNDYLSSVDHIGQKEGLDFSQSRVDGCWDWENPDRHQKSE